MWIINLFNNISAFAIESRFRDNIFLFKTKVLENMFKEKVAQIKQNKKCFKQLK